MTVIPDTSSLETEVERGIALLVAEVTDAVYLLAGVYPDTATAVVGLGYMPQTPADSVGIWATSADDSSPMGETVVALQLRFRSPSRNNNNRRAEQVYTALHAASCLALDWVVAVYCERVSSADMGFENRVHDRSDNYRLICHHPTSNRE